MATLNLNMQAAQRIRDAVSQVEKLRQERHADASLDAAVRSIKRLQGRRFEGTYSDLLGGGRYQAAARFFLDELYSDRDYAERDAQFSRIAGAMQKFFPSQVVATAVSLAELHALTEQLDHAMGLAWKGSADSRDSEASRYVEAWRSVGRRRERKSQLDVVMGIGVEMAHLTRTPGLRIMLKMMRGPASAAGMAPLQRFLESGFDTFASLSRQRRGVEEFLETIRHRESLLIASLFDDDFVACETRLAHDLGSCPVSK